ncbi:SPOR domain-containing protein [Sphingomonas sp. HF-S3]|uniref:SPOR domain-containing protein n=1 Tax=Sphingomonas rustica TaxID=3103142 RepID=A0ABV0B3G7_9SPHN
MPAFAQNEIVARPNPDADLLASEMRVLAQNPRDLRALLSAAAISTRLNDTSAALAFYARAEQVEPDNPRISAGRAAVLVRMERPGEALRLFDTAERLGLPMAEYASDRGLAYDLMGAPHLAQREYQQALRREKDDETVRRYALSLGITGKSDEAMRELEPLLRRSDRAAWRARAFILAMNGDVPAADRIAQSMMPANMGAALGPSFRRLQGMSPGDRAFAVHYGQMGRTTARIADAQMAPRLAPYVPDQRPVQMASAATPAQPARTARRGAEQPSSVEAARPARGRERASRRGRAQREVAAAQPAPTPAPAPVQMAAAEPPLPAPPRYVQPTEIVQPIPTPAPTPAPVAVASRQPHRAPAWPAGRETVQPTTPVARDPVRLASSTIVPAPASSRPSAAAAPRVGAEDNLLASIVDGIAVPENEREVVALPAPATRGTVTARTVTASPAPARSKPVAPVAAPKPKPAETRGKPAARAGDKADETADTAKGRKKEPAKPKPKVEPEPKRIWVQVAGGANEDMLPGAWRQLAKKAPAAFRGRSAWSAPLRATNRLLAGPFKTAAEAQTFVNQLKKEGMSAFVFTSEAGQKITKIAL